MRFVVPALLALLLTPGPARADDARRLDLAKTLMAQMHLADTMRSGLPLLAAQMRQTLAQQGRRSEDADAFVALYEEKLGGEMGRYGDLMAEAYAQVFTEDELTGLLAFDRTPLGEKLIARQPGLVQASILAMHSIAADAARDTVQEMDRHRQQNETRPRL